MQGVILLRNIREKESNWVGFTVLSTTGCDIEGNCCFPSTEMHDLICHWNIVTSSNCCVYKEHIHTCYIIPISTLKYVYIQAVPSLVLTVTLKGRGAPVDG